jgi:hypothetical protein
MGVLRWRLGENARKTGVYLSVNEDFEGNFDNAYAKNAFMQGSQ